MPKRSQLRASAEKEVKGESLQEYGKRVLRRRKKLPQDKFDKPSLSDKALYKVAQVQTAYRRLRRKKK